MHGTFISSSASLGFVVLSLKRPTLHFLCASGPDRVGRKELRQKLILFSQERFAGVIPRE